MGGRAVGRRAGRSRRSETVREEEGAFEEGRSDVLARYDRETGAFIAFNPDGVIRTFFRPNDGERYFRRQAERGE